MINNVVLSYSPTDEETPYKQGENGTVQSARSIVHKFLKWLCIDQAWKSIHLFVWFFFLVSFTSNFDQLKT